jgi:hypothetical protein
MHKVYVAGKQFNSKQELWNAIQAAAKEILAEVSKLTSSTRVGLILSSCDCFGCAQIW